MADCKFCTVNSGGWQECNKVEYGEKGPQPGLDCPVRLMEFYREQWTLLRDAVEHEAKRLGEALEQITKEVKL